MIQELKNAQDQSARRCSFCKLSEAEVGRLVEGFSASGAPPVYICANCVDLCSAMLDQEKQDEPPDAESARVTDAADALGRQIDAAVKNLDDLEFRIIELRYGLADGHFHSHEEVAKALEITPEKVQEIEAAAVEKLKPRCE
jgi:DNA-directed RNA polymerase specialized sigma subunit